MVCTTDRKTTASYVWLSNCHDPLFCLSRVICSEEYYYNTWTFTGSFRGRHSAFSQFNGTFKYKKSSPRIPLVTKVTTIYLKQQNLVIPLQGSQNASTALPSLSAACNNCTTAQRIIVKIDSAELH